MIMRKITLLLTLYPEARLSFYIFKFTILSFKQKKDAKCLKFNLVFDKNYHLHNNLIGCCLIFQKLPGLL